MTVYETPQAAKDAQFRYRGPDHEALTDGGELVGLFGGVEVHLFMCPPDSEPYGLRTTPVEPDEAARALAGLMDADGHADPVGAFYEALASDEDRADSWAQRHGFYPSSDAPEKRVTDEQGVTRDVYVLVAQ